MSDEMFEGEDESGVGAEAQPSKKGGFLPGIVIQILKWAALSLGAIIFIVTVVIITMKIMGAGSQSATQQQVSTDYTGKAPVYDWFSQVGEVRGRTVDENPAMVIVNINIGYSQGDKVVQTELVSRIPQLKDVIRQFFTSKRAADLKPEKENDLKIELAEKINSIMTSGKVRQVLFDNLQVIQDM
jgi:flagellar FliL protein